ncbi:M penetrans paralogue family 26 [Chlamydia trachomatis]|nr:M penetrans paralogue family 26 [Chlamydia trachomatis]
MYEANLGITVLFLIADDIIVFYILINAILMIALTIKVSLLKKYCRLYCKCF